MDIQNDLNVVYKYKKLYYFILLTSIAAMVPLSTPMKLDTNDDTIEDDDAQLIDTNRPTITFCDEKEKQRFLYISTLDGRLSALNILDGGKLHWSIETEPGPMLSSNIHRLELTNNGQFVRMIPSLSGAIYKFDGDTIEPIPITADNLLSSSAKFSDDLVISGGKEIRYYGVSARTGQLLYECNMNGCINTTDVNNGMKSFLKFQTKNAEELYDITSDKNLHRNQINSNDYWQMHDFLMDDVILIRRHTQTIRALETRTGIERWNFSVGQHELDLIPSSDCQRKFAEDKVSIKDLDIKIVVPEGVICVFSKLNPNFMLWKYKFDHPIVNAWTIDIDDVLHTIDMFASAKWIWNSDESYHIPLLPEISPSLYLGMYDKQLYIQESIELHKKIYNRSDSFTKISQLPKIPWRPKTVNGNFLSIIQPINKNSIFIKPNNIENKELIPYVNKANDEFALYAQYILNASDYVNGKGYYLYVSGNFSNMQLNEMCEEKKLKKNLSKDIIATSGEFQFNIDNMKTPVQLILYSMWCWWKEIVVITFTSALLINLFIGQRNHSAPEIVVIERHIRVPTAIEATESNVVTLNKFNTITGCNDSNDRNMESSANSYRLLSIMNSNPDEQFCSRFQSDFDLLRCLGRGGFGVVFEAKNKLDDCKYAIKRITLPNKEESRIRVMREVKTLANCEHQNIVRYFQSWVEKPPPGWQEKEDNKWLNSEVSTSIQIDTLTTETSQSLCFNSDNEWGRCHINRISKIYSNDIDRSDSTETIEKTDCIDIHNSSIDVSAPINGCNNCSQLSDSFQIEFVGSMNDDNSNNSHETPNINRKYKTRQLSININSSDDENNSGIVLKTSSKNTQNKIYLYIQMQLCRKESLRDWLREKQTEHRINSIAVIFHQIVDAVDYVHFKGLIHRDLKPSNIFFSQDGQIKIGDFGLVTDMAHIPNAVNKCENIATCNRHTQLVGTHLYMSPEQLHGLPYDYKVDIYSLGLIFFELLIYFGTEMERIKTLRSLRDGVYPKEFCNKYAKEYDLLRKMLATQPTERPTTSELKYKLNEILKIPDGSGDYECGLITSSVYRLSK